MSRLRIMTAALIAAGLAANSANAELFTFDELSAPSGFGAIPNGYAGLNWSQFYFGEAAKADPGYINAVVSTPNVAYNLIGVPASVSNQGGFNLISGFFTAPYSFAPTTVQVTTTGSSNQQKSFSINTTSPTEVIFDFYNITSATFSTTPSASTNFALDNLTVTLVPEPESWALMLLGLGVVSGLVRRRRREL